MDQIQTNIRKILKRVEENKWKIRPQGKTNP